MLSPTRRRRKADRRRIIGVDVPSCLYGPGAGLGAVGRDALVVVHVSFILVVSFAPDFLTVAGHSQTDAGAVVSIATWLTVIMGPVGGLLAERSGRPGIILAVSLTGFGAAVAAMTVWDAPIPLFANMGIIGGLAPGIIMALPARVVRSEVLAPARGLFYLLLRRHGPVTGGGWLDPRRHRPGRRTAAVRRRHFIRGTSHISRFRSVGAELTSGPIGSHLSWTSIFFEHFGWPISDPVCYASDQLVC
ncbi:MAG: hypothetical protein VCF08_18730 [Alphaproteobacteria bacterium]